MNHPINLTALAYAKGVNAAKTNRRILECPYGMTKLELQHWWIAGYNDQKNNNIDMVIYNAGTKTCLND